MNIRMYLILYWLSEVLLICENCNLDDLQNEIKKIGRNITMQLYRFSLIKEKINLVKQIGEYNNRLVELYTAATKNRIKVKEIIKRLTDLNDGNFLHLMPLAHKRMERYWKHRDLRQLVAITRCSDRLWDALEKIKKRRVVVGSKSYETVLKQINVSSRAYRLNDKYIRKRKYVEQLSDSSWEGTTIYPYYKLQIKNSVKKVANSITSQKKSLEIYKLWKKEQLDKLKLKEWLKQIKRFSYSSTLEPKTSFK